MRDAIIRSAVLADARAVLDLQHRAFAAVAQQYEVATLPPMLETIDELRATFATHTILVASSPAAVESSEFGGRIVGTVRAEVRDGTAHIGRMAVEPSLHGQGLGRRLLAAIEHEVAPVDAYELFTGHRSTRSILLYERAGYRQVRTAPDAQHVSLTYLTKVARPDGHAADPRQI